MTGDFVITREHLLALGACIAGVEFFGRTYPDGRAEYQDMLDKAVAGGGFGIYAGLRVQITETDRRTIKAASKPDNIMCGVWEDA